MSYFSRIQLDVKHPDARAAVNQILRINPYDDHQWLWKMFAAPQGTPRDFLFRRFDPHSDQRQPTFYVVSERSPQAIHEAWRVDSRTYAPEVEEGARLSFELRVNPVIPEMEARTPDELTAYAQQRATAGRAVREQPSRRKVYHDVVMHAKRKIVRDLGVERWGQVPDNGRPPLYELVHASVRDWFCSEDGNGGVAERHGFSIIPAALQVDGYRQHRIRRGSARPIQFSTVDLAGELTVRDASRFRRALMNGVGHAKAFGCGLLLVRRN